MDEAKRAAYYDAHRDDPQEFIEMAKTPVGRKREALTVTVAVRFSATEAEALQHMAQLEGKTYSEVIRRAVQRYARPDAVPSMTSTIQLSGLREDAPLTRRDAPLPSSVEFESRRVDSQTITSGQAISAR